eukprot:TRINITY_DN6634_c0_g1_i1.p1 TRINITY_DN6634_c0_g1~~TRINITY_DN6634_c0_g1_i1.p1  ORF type:complete len:792 (+),score=275.08 TRINITY_DN6634_c0_g1_i1:117-2492(+)
MDDGEDDGLDAAAAQESESQESEEEIELPEHDWDKERAQMRKAKDQPTECKLMLRNVPLTVEGEELNQLIGQAVLRAAGFEEAAETPSAAYPSLVCGLLPPKVETSMFTDAFIAFGSPEAASLAAFMAEMDVKGEPIKFQRPGDYDPDEHVAPEITDVTLRQLFSAEGMLTRREEELARVTAERDALLTEKARLKEQCDSMLSLHNDILADTGPLFGPTPPEDEEEEEGSEDGEEDDEDEEDYLEKERYTEDRPVYWGLRVEDVLKFRKRIEKDLAKFCGKHLRYVNPNSGKMLLVCKDSPCSYRRDHRHGETIKMSDDIKPHTAPLPQDMHVVTARYIRKECMKTKSSYALKLHDRSPLKAGTYVAHCWSQDFNDFVDVLDAALDPKEVVWISSFSLNQTTKKLVKVREDLPSHSHFALALRSVRQVLVPIDAGCEFANRLWTQAEMNYGREMRIPTLLWPCKNADLAKAQQATEKLDTKKSPTSDRKDEEPLRNMLQEGCGSLRKVNLRLRAFLQERINSFKAATAEIKAEVAYREKAAAERGTTYQDLFRLRQRVVELERDVARRDPSLRGDFEFADCDGALFGYPSYVPQVRDSLLMRDVWHINGLCSFKSWGTLILPEGTWRVGFACKAEKNINFDMDVVLFMFGKEMRKTRLDKELNPGSGWVFLEIGEVTGGDGQEVDLCMADFDFDFPAAPQPKFGLFVDRVVARKTAPGLEGEPGSLGIAPPLFADAALRQIPPPQPPRKATADPDEEEAEDRLGSKDEGEGEEGEEGPVPPPAPPPGPPPP